MAQVAPSADRNKDAIWEVLRSVLPPPRADAEVKLLEVATGTGQHAAHFAALRSDLLVQPTDVTLDMAASAAAYASQAGPEVQRRVLPLKRLDVLQPLGEDVRAIAPFDAAMCINMLHISPPECGEKLFAIVAEALQPGGLLLTYGPYRLDGFLVQSNIDFENNFLKQKDERFSIREVRELEQLAGAHGFTLEAIHDMPANNKSLIWRFRGGAGHMAAAE
eukprot:CAMPEP_0170235894 /NCGR_PEP_ID=MMETSP0116_2-20130129/17693_1 /TAXON_ID=400756 /ORGANISM="Durinskia baltica, Strain CSIRO CS-38" /LENGTH=219 /DNA_ID=CAMNT_0010486689 /DNA_START=29 /DNA_END=688 /DNA_ORIENTATION=+